MTYRVVSLKNKPEVTHLFDHKTPDSVVCRCGDDVWVRNARVGRPLKRLPYVTCGVCQKIIARLRLLATITGCEQRLFLPSEIEVAELKGDLGATNFWVVFERDDEDDWCATVNEYGVGELCNGRGRSPSKALVNALEGKEQTR